MLSTRVRPTPVRLKIVSVRTAPLMTSPKFKPITVITGSMAFFQGVLANDDAFTQTLGARRTDVILIQHFKNARAAHARDDGQRNGADSYRRQNQMPQRVDEQLAIQRQDGVQRVNAREEDQYAERFITFRHQAVNEKKRFGAWSRASTGPTAAEQRAYL